jgi:hypothetical protein
MMFMMLLLLLLGVTCLLLLPQVACQHCRFICHLGSFRPASVIVPLPPEAAV